MSEMVDRVERVMTDLNGEVSTRYIARAVIAAMREPTKQMIDEGHCAVAFEDYGLSSDEYREQPAVCYRAMIDEALGIRAAQVDLSAGSAHSSTKTTD